MVETLQYTYTTQAEMERVMGVTQFMNYVDDDGDREAESDIVEGVIIECTDEVNFFLEKRYDPADLNQSTWVRRHCTYLGCFFLTERRGGPEHYAEKAKRCLERFISVARGEYQVPRLPVRGDFTPSMSNLRIEDRYANSKIRIVSTDVVGGTYSEQFLGSNLYNRFYRALR